MKELAGRLAALDPDAGAAVNVIAYFDRLVEGRAGLESVVRGAAALAGCAARLVDDDRRLHIVVGPDGRRHDRVTPVDPTWLGVPLVRGGPAVLWLERSGAAGPVEAMVLERAAAAVRAVLDRTRPGLSTTGNAQQLRPDPAAVEVIVDVSASVADRRQAARRLGLDGARQVRALALDGLPPQLELVTTTGRPERSERPKRPESTGRRTGVGPAVSVADLPSSWAAARTALRLAAEGTEQDPGPQVVHADELGGLAVLAAAVGPDTAPVADVVALDRAGADARWMLATLEAVASHASLRAAAAALTVHHSTLQERLARAERMLGFSVHDPAGRLRLQLALALRRLHRHQTDQPRQVHERQVQPGSVQAGSVQAGSVRPG